MGIKVTQRLVSLVITVMLLALPLHLFGAESDGEERVLITSGSKWEELAAYSRAAVDGDWIFLSGTVGFDPEDGQSRQTSINRWTTYSAMTVVRRREKANK